jgi:hypothetical protein
VAAQQARKLGLRVTASTPNANQREEQIPSRLGEYPSNVPGADTMILDLKFNLKVTDVSELSNPFVIFEDSPVSTEGVLSIDPGLISPHKKLISDPRDYFPWLKKPQDIERRTLKIEVVYRSDLIMCRYLHLNRLYPIEYPKIALQISNNIY